MIIQFSYYYPPTHSVAVLRNYTFSQYFNNLDQDVHVVTPKLSASASKDHSLSELEGIKVHHVMKLDYRTFIPLFNKSGNIHLTDDQRRSNWKQWIIKFINTIPFNFFIGEGGPIYILNGYLLGRKLIQESKEPITLFSSFRPYADHYICWLLKRSFPQCKWIADFRDLHVDPLYKHVLNPKRQEKRNQNLLTKADVVTTVSEGLAVSLRRIHNNVKVLENPVRPLDTTSLPEKYEKFTISYTGSLYGNERDPTLIFKAIKQLHDRKLIDISSFQFLYAGKDEAAIKKFALQFGVDKYLDSIGFVTRAEALELQQKSHINLLLTSSIPEMRGILTGKLFEYLSDYNPIVTIINGDEDWIFEDLYNSFEIGYLTYHLNSIEGLITYLINMLKTWEEGERLQNLSEREKVQERYCWKGKIEALV